MNTILWIIKGGFAIVFFVTGISKLVRAKEQLLTPMGALENLSLTQICRFGFAEVAGGAGLILPSLTRMLPWLSAPAAVWLVMVMIGASVANIRRKEYSTIALTSLLLFLSLLVAVGQL